jgi:hypothetical protein
VKTRISVCVMVVCVMAFASVASAQSPADKPVLTELQQAKADLFKYQVEIAQLRATLAERESRLASVELSAKQKALADEFLRSAKAPPGSTWDWGAMAPKLPDAPKTPDAKPVK